MAATSGQNVWLAEQRSAHMPFYFDDRSYHEQRIVFQDLGKARSQFPLYYFVKDLTYNSQRGDAKDARTILFVAGGPGQLILPDTENFLDMFGYRVVYFHVRGSGFSQIPEDSVNDVFLTTSRIVEDIETIRADLKIKSWKAVIGHSYGAVVAHEYARLHEKQLEKLILSAPMVPASLNKCEKKPDKVNKHLEALRMIYQRKEFEFLDHPNLVVRVLLSRSPTARDVRQYLIEVVKGIIDELAKKHLSLTSAVNDFAPVQKIFPNYDVSLFGAIRRVQHVGWLALDVPYARPLRTPKVDDTQVECGLVIAREILLKNFGLRIESLLNKRTLEAKLADGLELFRRNSSLKTDRCFFAIAHNDGLFDRFRRNSAKAVSATYLGIPASGQKPPDAEPWNRIKGKDGWTQSKPTLIFKGGADPISKDYEADYFLSVAPKDERVLIEFPGVGHSIALPDVHVSDPRFSEHPDLLKAAVTTNGGKTSRFMSTRDKLIDQFLESKTIREFEQSKIVASTRRAFEHCLAEQGKIELNAYGRTGGKLIIKY